MEDLSGDPVPIGSQSHRGFVYAQCGNAGRGSVTAARGAQNIPQMRAATTGRTMARAQRPGDQDTACEPHSPNAANPASSTTKTTARLAHERVRSAGEGEFRRIIPAAQCWKACR